MNNSIIYWIDCIIICFIANSYEIKQNYQNCKKRGIVIQSVEVSYNSILSNESRIRRYEINDNEIPNIYQQIDNLKHQLDENEEIYNKTVQEVLINLARILYILKLLI